MNLKASSLFLPRTLATMLLYFSSSYRLEKPSLIMQKVGLTLNLDSVILVRPTSGICGPEASSYMWEQPLSLDDEATRFADLFIPVFKPASIPPYFIRQHCYDHIIALVIVLSHMMTFLAMFGSSTFAASSIDLVWSRRHSSARLRWILIGMESSFSTYKAAPPDIQTCTKR
ncbi:hypothetical protein K431DRAFT_331851 [Polychaeton citri CBS 116435]|uniref:Uncharacterized protein n=1 Tax=Polychaeton citri CBS 116435 TaxID=1314669 RepID=A0A9P4Q5T8_9PEZI|nr:hypothetical protein K431DRAFT_331851 [Polychaeton citri CBS 116435]